MSTKTDTPAAQPSIEDKVNDIVDSMTKGEDGTWQIPTDTGEELGFAAMAERRRRDTQADFGRKAQELKVVKTENSKLTEAWANDVRSVLTEDQKTELDTLKQEDPEAWRLKLNEHEQANGETFKERRETISKEAAQESEEDQRTRLMAEFTEANPDLNLTDELIANELPPKYLKALENGEATFSEFLANAKDYLTKGKVITPGTKVGDEPNLGKAKGGARPESEAVNKEIVNSYDKETY